MQVLILAGTTEATALARLLEGHPRLDGTVSLAGRTARPARSNLPQRTGGFGGVAGLADYLRTNRMEAVVDATHPFAARISTNAAAAARQAGVPLAALERPPWEPTAGDHWIPVADLDAAAEALHTLGHRVLVTTGRQELAPYERAPDKHYVIRTIDPPEPPPALPDAAYIQDRGPFDRDAEAALMDEHGIEVLVTKNSGGDATRGKLDAARERGIPVIMVERPARPEGVPVHHDPAAALQWLEDLAAGGHSASS
ncbi:cobalt-precorrin-6X reductase [Thiohalorhabdus denitrificans]|uniref:Precorrin-6A/cobalt-precorrin-6A reductase n=1 Tax=Thiohalorhabdus denitrificans TaxID=381306 RepID=A0A0P9C2A1_9GAMM|nr:cobalt-precorrin-6A reductase [Thiohalorhabdus denitrificans]KPV39065.1 cobalt-precorrin-6X reductase [Thiohalorhabdus denitrificans]SCX78546.1 precorrin-6A/cobalt-precorrin-6A reductase [Thiohalorhabdus denitrificans]